MALDKAPEMSAVDGPTYDVIVGNVGTVYAGTDATEARATFTEYVSQSQSGYGRASGEPVTLMRDGNIIDETEADSGR